MTEVVPSYGSIIVGHFCKRVAICVYFLEQDIERKTESTKKYLMIYKSYLKWFSGRSIASLQAAESKRNIFRC